MRGALARYFPCRTVRLAALCRNAPLRPRAQRREWQRPFLHRGRPAAHDNRFTYPGRACSPPEEHGHHPRPYHGRRNRGALPFARRRPEPPRQARALPRGPHLLLRRAARRQAQRYRLREHRGQPRVLQREDGRARLRCRGALAGAQPPFRHLRRSRENGERTADLRELELQRCTPYHR